MFQAIILGRRRMSPGKAMRIIRTNAANPRYRNRCLFTTVLMPVLARLDAT